MSVTEVHEVHEVPEVHEVHEVQFSVCIHDYLMFLEHMSRSVPQAVFDGILNTSYNQETRTLVITCKAAIPESTLDCFQQSVDAWSSAETDVQ